MRLWYGLVKARGLQVGFGPAGTGKTQCAAKFKIGYRQTGLSPTGDEVNVSGWLITAYLFFTPAARKASLEMLRVMGWKTNNLADIAKNPEAAGVYDNEVLLKVIIEGKIEGREDRRRVKVSYIRPIGGLGLVDIFQGEELAGLDTELAQDIRESRRMLPGGPVRPAGPPRGAPPVRQAPAAPAAPQGRGQAPGGSAWNPDPFGPPRRVSAGGGGRQAVAVAPGPVAAVARSAGWEEGPPAWLDEAPPPDEASAPRGLAPVVEEEAEGPPAVEEVEEVAGLVEEEAEGPPPAVEEVEEVAGLVEEEAEGPPAVEEVEEEARPAPPPRSARRGAGGEVVDLPALIERISRAKTHGDLAFVVPSSLSKTVAMRHLQIDLNAATTAEEAEACVKGIDVDWPDDWREDGLMLIQARRDELKDKPAPVKQAARARSSSRAPRKVRTGRGV